MAKKMVSVRLDEGLVEWLDGYAKERGIDRTRLLELAVGSFRDECARGVPDVGLAAVEGKPGKRVDTPAEARELLEKRAPTWGEMRQERLRREMKW